MDYVNIGSALSIEVFSWKNGTLYSKKMDAHPQNYRKWENYELLHKRRRGTFLDWVLNFFRILLTILIRNQPPKEF